MACFYLTYTKFSVILVLRICKETYFMIKRFILWLLRTVAILAGLIGILMIIGGALGISNTLISGIVVLVVSFVVGSSTARKSEKAQTENRRKCKKCGRSMIGAYYEYRAELKIRKELGCNSVQIPVNVTCPHCGKVKTIIETVYCHDGESKEEIQRDLEKQLEEYYG